MAATVVSWTAMMGSDNRERKSLELWSGPGFGESPQGPFHLPVQSLEGAVKKREPRGQQTGKKMCERHRSWTLGTRWPVHIRKHLSSQSTFQARLHSH